ncbi:MAG: WhiB family transcriptional regulator [Actinomycetota bacterium]
MRRNPSHEAVGFQTRRPFSFFGPVRPAPTASAAPPRPSTPTTNHQPPTTTAPTRRPAMTTGFAPTVPTVGRINPMPRRHDPNLDLHPKDDSAMNTTLIDPPLAPSDAHDDESFDGRLDLLAPDEPRPPTRRPVARCADGNGTLTGLFFSDHVADIGRAKAICGLCPLQAECLAGALEREEPWGVWGGELISGGRIVHNKRPCGRPPKNPRPEIVYDEMGPVGVVA